ncbi:O-antigen ligase family protein [Rhodanobacter sp. DHG33]|nr:O-antigen ligase family protein [Rhodanobacter sp. DHG33]
MLLVLAGYIASSATGLLSLFLLSLYAMLGRAQAIQALALSWLLSVLSPGIAVQPNVAAVGRFAVEAGAMLSVVMAGMRSSGVQSSMIRGSVFATLLLGGGIIVHSLFFSEMPAVSLLKAISWTVTVCTLLAAWEGLRYQDRLRLERQLFGGLVVLMLVSLPLLPTTLGYLKNGAGFQGILNQPQAFGLTVGLLAAWAGGRILAERKVVTSNVVIFSIAVISVILSQARTAGLALILALIVSVVVGPWIARRRRGDFVPGFRNRRIQLAVVLVLIGAIGAGPLLGKVVHTYIVKRGTTTNLDEVYDNSRGKLIIPMLANIAERPFQGIGFGIDPDSDDFVIQRDPLFGLPIGAPVENGNIYIAAWEQLGIFGLIAVLVWIWMLLRRAVRRGGMIAMMVCMTALLENMGEATLFSPSGMGMLVLILITWATSVPLPLLEETSG